METSIGKTDSGTLHLIINFLPVTLSSREVTGIRMGYKDRPDLDTLKRRLARKYLARRSGEYIYCIPVSQGIENIEGDSVTLTTDEECSTFRFLIEEGLRAFLKQQYSGHSDIKITSKKRIIITATGDKNDLLRAALAGNKPAYDKLNFLRIHRKYYVRVTQIWDKTIEDFHFGIILKVGTKWLIKASVADLQAKGIDLAGCYVVPVDTWQDPEQGNRLAGCISSIEHGRVKLTDYRDQEYIDASNYTIEASVENINRCTQAILGSGSARVAQQIRSEIAKLLRPEGQQQRIKDIANLLAKNSIDCAGGLSITVDKLPFQTKRSTFIATTMFNPPSYLLKYGGSPIAGTIASAIASQGPFDQDSFQKTTPYILVISPKQYLGRVDQYFGAWKNGRLNKYPKGFVARYRLRGCELHFVDFQETGNAPEDYRQACEQALIEMQEKIRRYDLAFVIIREGHRLLGSNDPYLITKATLMNYEIPVQEIEIETIDLPDNSRPFVFNNLSLASYAKMGGIPWVLASPKGKGIMHELVFGVGSSIVRSGRLQEQERFVGITTMFDYDGFYRLSTITQETTFDEYSQELERALLKSLQYVSAQKGWQSGDRVRLIFHTSKPLKNLEITAVKSLVASKLPDYIVDFAFLEIGRFHDWIVFDPESLGHTMSSGSVRGKQVPKRGTALFLGERKALLSVTGPAEMKFYDQGCPRPLQIVLHGASTFQDIVYLANQIFDFTHMSWKTFNTLPMPVTIEYSESIARLLGRLRRVKNWNSGVLQTTQLSRSLWFL